MRPFLSFLMASAILVAGLALGVFEIARPEGDTALPSCWRGIDDWSGGRVAG